MVLSRTPYCGDSNRKIGIDRAECTQLGDEKSIIQWIVHSRCVNLHSVLVLISFSSSSMWHEIRAPFGLLWKPPPIKFQNPSLSSLKLWALIIFLPQYIFISLPSAPSIFYFFRLDVKLHDKLCTLRPATSCRFCVYVFRLRRCWSCVDQLHRNLSYRPRYVCTLSLYLLTVSLVRPRRSRTGLVVRFIAIFRWLAYPSPRFLGTYEYYDPAAAALIVAFSIYALVWVLIASEYDTEQCLQSVSPALSVRAGWFSLSTTPFIFALATKKNPISFITGMSYHDLSIYHRCTSSFAL